MRGYLSESERKRRYFIFRIKLYVAISLLVLFGTGVMYVLRSSAAFRLQAVEITGLNDRDKDLLLANLRAAMFQNSRTKFLGVDNYLSWPSSLESFSGIYRDVHIDKKVLKRMITVEAAPRRHFGAWCPISESSACRWIDDVEGTFLEKTARPAGQLIPTITESIDRRPMLGEVFLEQQEFARVKQILEFMRESSISGEQMELNRELNEIRITETSGALIRFSLRFDPDTNLAGFREIVADTGIKSIRELNLTVPGKIYLTRR